MMRSSLKRAFRQRFCRAPHCRVLFFICPSCDRGQRYCSRNCRDLNRRDQLRAARRRHQASQEGRLDHRDRQRAYRRRLQARQAAQKSVTDQSSTPSRTSAMIHLMTFEARLAKVPGRVYCRFCGRCGEFLAPYHESG